MLKTETVSSETLKSRRSRIRIPIRFRRALRSIQTISKLKDNWNENGAKHFEKALIRKCIGLLNTLKNFPPEVFPVADNSIQMEYNSDDGSYLQFRIYKDKIREFFFLSDGQKFTKYIEESEVPEEVKIFHEQLYK